MRDSPVSTNPMLQNPFLQSPFFKLPALDPGALDSPLFKGSPILQGLARSWTVGTPPAAWPMALVHTYWVDLPLAVSSHVQRFASAQVQAQMRLLSEMSHAEGSANMLMKEAGFLQQSAVAWGGECLEILELCQEKLLNPLHEEEVSEEQTFPRAA